MNNQQLNFKGTDTELVSIVVILINDYHPKYNTYNNKTKKYVEYNEIVKALIDL